jgi:hypothetical protein
LPRRCSRGQISCTCCPKMAPETVS